MLQICFRIILLTPGLFLYCYLSLSVINMHLIILFGLHVVLICPAGPGLLLVGAVEAFSASGVVAAGTLGSVGTGFLAHRSHC